MQAQIFVRLYSYFVAINPQTQISCISRKWTTLPPTRIASRSSRTLSEWLRWKKIASLYHVGSAIFTFAWAVSLTVAVNQSLAGMESHKGREDCYLGVSAFIWPTAQGQDIGMTRCWVMVLSSLIKPFSSRAALCTQISLEVFSSP